MSFEETLRRQAAQFPAQVPQNAHVPQQLVSSGFAGPDAATAFMQALAALNASAARARAAGWSLTLSLHEQEPNEPGNSVFRELRAAITREA